MREIGIPTWQSFLDTVDPMVPTTANQLSYIFRGQSVAEWNLSCSLLRALHATTHIHAIAAEQYSLQQFRSNALRFAPQEDIPPHLPAQPIMEWWSLMQHYGVPTRLLDLTGSPYVAAYFACELNWNQDGAMYFMRRAPIEQSSPKQQKSQSSMEHLKYLLSPGAAHAVRTYFPARVSDRFAAQQGLFLYSENILADLQEDLEKLFEPSMKKSLEPSFAKIIIKKEMKKEFMMKLRTMNVTAQTLFPGVDGLGRFVAEGIRIGLTL